MANAAITDQNPYWDEHIKPHKVDVDEIRMLCLEAFQIVLSSRGAAALYTRDEADESNSEGADGNEGDEGGSAETEHADETGPTRLLTLYCARAERGLSNALLKIAILVRTLQDQIYEVEADALESALAAIVAAEGSLGTVFDLPKGADDELNFRECCNKIIHAEDFRPVYDNDNRPRDEGGWAMDGQIELRGRHGKTEWTVAVYLTVFLEVVLAFCDEVEKAA